MRFPGFMLCLGLAACTSAPLRLGSEIPFGAELTPGRIIESKQCGELAEAYAQLERQARGDLITDVEVSEGTCFFMRARAVKLATVEKQERFVKSLAPGMSVRLREGTDLLNRPVEGSAKVDIGLTVTGLTLKSPVTTKGQTWWFITFKGGSGWALDTNLIADSPTPAATPSAQ